MSNKTSSRPAKYQFSPLTESVYLARPAKLTAPISLQAQRINTSDGFVEPLFDIKKNTKPITKLIKKVKSLNDAVVSIIPETPHRRDSGSFFSNSVSSPTSEGGYSSPQQSSTSPTISLHATLLQHQLETKRDHLCACRDLQRVVPQFSDTGSNKPSPNTFHSIGCPQYNNSSKMESYSIYDRESKEPLAYFNRYQLAFTTKSTPLLSKSSRLDRIKEKTAFISPDVANLDGPANWVIIPEFHYSKKARSDQRSNNDNKSRRPVIKSVSFKVVDVTTNIVIGKWKRRSVIANALANSRSKSPSYESSEDDNEEDDSLNRKRRVTFQIAEEDEEDSTTKTNNSKQQQQQQFNVETLPSYESTASNRYFLSDMKSLVHNPFFSGQVYSMAQGAANKLNEEWCFVLNIKSSPIVATLKGYELHLVDAHDSPLNFFFLDEYVQYLRHRAITKQLKASSTSLMNPNEENNRLTSSNSINNNLSSSNQPHHRLSPSQRAKRTLSLTSVSSGSAPLNRRWSMFSKMSSSSNYSVASSAGSVATPTSSYTTSSSSPTLEPSPLVKSPPIQDPWNTLRCASSGKTVPCSAQEDSFAFSENFYRVRFNDALIMLSMTLLLNMDHMIRCGVLNSDPTAITSNPESVINNNNKNSFSANSNYTTTPLPTNNSSSKPSKDNSNNNHNNNHPKSSVMRKFFFGFLKPSKSLKV